MTLRRATLEVLLKTRDVTRNAVRRMVSGFKEIGRVGPRAFRRISRHAASSHTQILGILGTIGLWRTLVKQPADYAENLAKVGTLGDEARGKLSEFEKQIDAIGTATGTPFSQLSDGLFNTISAGVKAGNAITHLSESNRLAIAGSADLGQTVKGLTAIMEAYGAETDRAREFAEVLFATQVIGKTTVNEVANVIGNVATTTANANVPVNELSAALGNLTKVTGSTEEAQTTLKAAIVALSKPSNDLREIMESAGIGIGRAAFEGRTLGEVFAALKKESDAQGKSFEELGVPVRALVAFYQLGSRGGANFAEALADQQVALGQLQPSFELMNSTLNSNLKRWKNLGLVVARAFSRDVLGSANKSLSDIDANMELNVARAEYWGTALSQVALGFRRVVNATALVAKQTLNIVDNWEEVQKGIGVSVAIWIRSIQLRWKRFIQTLKITTGALTPGVAFVLETILNMFRTAWHRIRTGFEILWKRAQQGLVLFAAGTLERVEKLVNGVLRLVGEEPIELQLTTNLNEVEADLQADVKKLQAEFLKDPKPIRFASAVGSEAIRSAIKANKKLTEDIEKIEDSLKRLREERAGYLDDVGDRAGTILDDFLAKDQELANRIQGVAERRKLIEAEILDLIERQGRARELQASIEFLALVPGADRAAPPSAPAPTTGDDLLSNLIPDDAAAATSGFWSNLFDQVDNFVKRSNELLENDWLRAFSTVAAEIQSEIDDLTGRVREFSLDARDALTDGLILAMDSAIDKTVSLKDAFEATTISILRSLQRIAAQTVSDEISLGLTRALQGVFSGGGSEEVPQGIILEPDAAAAHGLVVDREMIVRVGEAGEPEVIIPSPNRMVPMHVADAASGAAQRVSQFVEKQFDRVGGTTASPSSGPVGRGLLPEFEVRLPAGPRVPVALSGGERFEEDLFATIAQSIQQAASSSRREANDEDPIAGRDAAVRQIRELAAPLAGASPVSREVRQRIDQVATAVEEFALPKRRMQFGGLVHFPTDVTLGEGVFPEAVIRAPGGSIPVDIGGAEQLVNRIHELLRRDTAAPAPTATRFEVELSGADQLQELFRNFENRILDAHVASAETFVRGREDDDDQPSRLFERQVVSTQADILREFTRTFERDVIAATPAEPREDGRQVAPLLEQPPQQDLVAALEQVLRQLSPIETPQLGPGPALEREAAEPPPPVVVEGGGTSAPVSITANFVFEGGGQAGAPGDGVPVTVDNLPSVLHTARVERALLAVFEKAVSSKRNFADLRQNRRRR